MKISFVIPAYNEEAYLAQCLQAIIRESKQTSVETEIIVVNNASTDNTRAVALSFPEVTVVDEPIKGLPAARQAGFLRASGNLIANIDADSSVPAGWIEFVAKKFFQTPELIALSGPVIYADLPVFSNLLIRFYYYLAYISYLLNRFILNTSSLIQGGNFVVRFEALKKIKGFNTDISFYGEDTDIARRLHTLGPVVFTLSLPMYTSGRRLKAEGLLTMGWKYPINYLWILLFKKPFHNIHTDIRPQHTVVQQTTIGKLNTSLIIAKAFLAGVVVIIVFGMTHSPAKIALVQKATAMEASSPTLQIMHRGFISATSTFKRITSDSDDK